jgi:hypothetical protein
VYSTCIFCSQALGRNEMIEHFPVGRRLAFHAAKGRLWVVCRKCERWNLTPLEERWEAIEECERAFRGTKVRTSTDHVGLARMKDGTDLVRIGEPQRPEMAAWRYGDQFGRRQRKQILGSVGVAFALPMIGYIGISVGLLGVSTAMPVLWGLEIGHSAWRSRSLVRLQLGNGTTAAVRRFDLRRARLFVQDDAARVGLPVFRPRSVVNLLNGESSWVEEVYAGEQAMSAVASLLPLVNGHGASRKEVSRAVEFLDQSSGTADVFRRAAEAVAPREPRAGEKPSNVLWSMPSSARLALEMATHEESERRALEGELHILEAAWRDAEEVAGIADDMFLPPSIDESLARLKRLGDQGE